MATKYSYIKSTVDIGRLSSEILSESGIITTLLYCNFNGPSSLDIYFDADINGSEQTLLDTVVSNHDGTPLPEPAELPTGEELADSIIVSDGEGGSTWINVETLVSESVNHNILSGLDNDDHLQYVPVDGSRGFTNTVSGVDPTEDYHLTTKQYVDLNTTSDEEKWCYQIKLAKIRTTLLYKAYNNFVPSGYDVYPIIAHNWRVGTTAEYEHADSYPQTIVIKSGTAINFEYDGWMFYVKSTDVHSESDSVQNDDPKMEYFKRLKYIQNNSYLYITAWMSDGAWNTQAITPGIDGSLLIAYTFNNIREFTIFNNATDRHLYHGNLQTDGYSNLGFERHENEFFIPFDEILKFDVRAGNNPCGGGVYTVKYINLPNWW